MDIKNPHFNQSTRRGLKSISFDEDNKEFKVQVLLKLEKRK